MRGAAGSSNRVLRGGSFRNDADNARCSYRNDNHPDNRNDDIGFRPAKVLTRPIEATPRRLAAPTITQAARPRSLTREPNRQRRRSS